MREHLTDVERVWLRKTGNPWAIFGILNPPEEVVDAAEKEGAFSDQKHSPPNQ